VREEVEEAKLFVRPIVLYEQPTQGRINENKLVRLREPGMNGARDRFQIASFGITKQSVSLP